MKASVLTEKAGLTAAEVDQCHQYVDETGNGIADATRGLTEAQWTFRETADRWSIAEIVEHIVLIQEVVLGPVRERLSAAPDEAEGRDYKQVEDIIYQQFPARSGKIEAPDFSAPTGRWTPVVSLERLSANCASLKAYVESTPELRSRVIESAPLKRITNDALQYMDGYQWALAAAAHTKRHLDQISQVKRDPGFPV